MYARGRRRRRRAFASSLLLLGAATACPSTRPCTACRSITFSICIGFECTTGLFNRSRRMPSACTAPFFRHSPSASASVPMFLFCSHTRMCMPTPRRFPSKYACAENECTRNSNPRLANPDGLIVGTDTVGVGPVYAVQKGDTLLSIAAMARTTIKSILHVNSDLAVSTHLDLQPGHDICLLLCTSVPLA